MQSLLLLAQTLPLLVTTDAVAALAAHTTTAAATVLCAAGTTTASAVLLTNPTIRSAQVTQPARPARDIDSGSSRGQLTGGSGLGSARRLTPPRGPRRSPPL